MGFIDRLAGHISRWRDDRRGSIPILSAFLMPIMIGVGSLAVEYGHALTTRVENQRVADLASYAGALSYGRNKSESTMVATARTITNLNGIDADDVEINLAASPRDADDKGVFVTIDTKQQLYFAKLFDASDLTISTNAVAQVPVAEDNNGACVIALDPNGTGITMSGGTTLAASDCAIASNATITSPCGTKIVTKAASYNSATAPEQPEWCRTIQKKDGTPAPITKSASPDPFADNTYVAAASAQIEENRKLLSPLEPVVAAGADLTFDPWNNAKRTALDNALQAQGCTETFANSTFTVTCDARDDTRKFGNFLIGSGLTVNFDVPAPGTSRAVRSYSFASIKSEGGASFRFGPGRFTVAKGISASGSSARFGAGTFEVGRSTVCGYSLCGNNNGELTFDGPSTFTLSSGLYTSGSNVTKLGAGSAENAYHIGASSGGKAIEVRGGTAILADAKGSGGVFQAFGKITSGGGTCMVLPAADQHPIEGSLDVQGALELGAGIYTIDGFMALGQQSGGAVNCNGSRKSLYAKDVTLVLSGKETATGWACSGAAFCASAGYNDMILSAPDGGVSAKFAIIGPIAANGGAALSGGASGGQISGAFYFPQGKISMSGGASAGDTSSTCLTMVGKSFTLSGGTSAASKCTGLAGATAGASKISLVR